MDFAGKITKVWSKPRKNGQNQAKTWFLFCQQSLQIACLQLKLHWEDALSRRKTHKPRQIPRIVPGLGGWQNSVYVFSGSFFIWGANTRDNPTKHLFMCFFIVGFSLPLLVAIPQLLIQASLEERLYVLRALSHVALTAGHGEARSGSQTRI